MKIPVKAFACTMAIFSALSFLLIAWWGMALGYGGEVDGLFGKLYSGYSYSFMGSLIGAAWGFVDWGIGGALFAWLFNWVSAKCP